jgi:hypothetical protein
MRKIKQKLTSYLPPLVIFSWIWLSLILSLGAAWHTLAKVDFGYAIWYEYGGIKEFIYQYAPQNRFKADFELASEQQHIDAFHGIVESIQNHGSGLAEIRYKVGNKTHQLLHQAEIVHLQDVANLIDFLNQCLILLFFIWLFLSFRLLKKPKEYNKTQASVAIAIGASLLSLPLFIFGAKEVFYQFHVWVFPDNHQWFFYYQDSLMSTMMKAPDLFAYIALCLVFTSLAIYLIFIKSLGFFTKRP